LKQFLDAKDKDIVEKTKALEVCKLDSCIKCCPKGGAGQKFLPVRHENSVLKRELTTAEIGKESARIKVSERQKRECSEHDSDNDGVTPAPKGWRRCVYRCIHAEKQCRYVPGITTVCLIWLFQRLSRRQSVHHVSSIRSH
jgi:hypothetical protein